MSQSEPEIVRVDVPMLQGVLQNVTRPQPIAIVARTIPQMRRRQNPWWDKPAKTWDLVRVRHVSGFVCSNYERAVIRRRKREGVENADDFQTQGRSWGQHRYTESAGGNGQNRPKPKRTALVKHGSKSYVEIQRGSTYRLEHQLISTGEVIDDALVEPWLSRPIGVNAYDAIRQGVEQPVEVRDYLLTNVASLTIAGTRYVVTPCPNANIHMNDAAEATGQNTSADSSPKFLPVAA